MTHDARALAIHRERNGKLEIAPTVPLETMDDLAVAYTPGVAAVCRAIAEDRSRRANSPSRGVPSQS